MALTIEEARAQVLEYLDDEKGARYAPTSLGTAERYKKLDRQLRSAQNRRIDEYAAEGGDRFNERISVTTSATDGTVVIGPGKLEGGAANKIRGVLYAPSANSAIYRIDPGDELQTQIPDKSERDLTVAIIKRFDIPATPQDDDLLMGTVAGRARSWDAFDQWICVGAAIQMNVKDVDRKRTEALALAEQSLRASVLGHPRNPDVLPMPNSDRLYWNVIRYIRYIWIARTQTLQLILGGS